MITVHNLSKTLSNQLILHDLSFQIEKGEVIGLIGPSGSGKSTLLKCLHGLEPYQQGSIQRQGQTGLIFQQFNLFPHLNVVDNILYAPLNVLKANKQHTLQTIMPLVEKMGLIEKLNSPIQALSGGQKQRVAILRALALQPDILLLDEPTSALDPTLVQEVASIIQCLKNQNFTVIIASHEVSFIHQVADRILFLDQGCLVYDQSKNHFFAQSQSAQKHKFLAAYYQHPHFNLNEVASS